MRALDHPGNRSHSHGELEPRPSNPRRRGPLRADPQRAAGEQVDRARDDAAGETRDEALQRRRRELDELERIAQIGSWEWDLAAGVVHCSEEMGRMLGAAGACDLPTRAFFEHVHPEDRDATRAALDRAGWEASRFAIEHRILRPDGAVRVLYARGRVAVDAEGRAQRLLGTAKDLTERRSLERHDRELLREQAAREAAEDAASRFRFLSEASERLARSLDTDETARSITRLTVPRIADWCSVDLVAPGGELRQIAIAHTDPERERVAREVRARFPVVQGARKPYAEALRRGEAVLVADFDDTALHEASNGAEHLAVLRAFGVRSAMVVPLMARGRPIGLVSLATAESGRRFGPDDVSLVEALAVRAALAIDNARLFGEARDAARVREEMAATLSHDLRSPLGVVSMTAALLRDELTPAERSAAIDRIDRAVRSMDRMINDLLDMARIEAGALAITLRREPAALLLAEACEMAQSAAVARGVERARRADPALAVRADRDRVLQVLANLVDNALRHSPPGAKVELSVEADGDVARFTVADEGPGIPPDQRDRIFQRFWRKQPDRRGGAGLGLTIALGLVELHGGRIWVAAADQPGARVCFTLPLDG
jgi:PAS domain S-box-containing protein